MIFVHAVTSGEPLSAAVSPKPRFRLLCDLQDCSVGDPADESLVNRDLDCSARGILPPSGRDLVAGQGGPAGVVIRTGWTRSSRGADHDVPRPCSKAPSGGPDLTRRHSVWHLAHFGCPRRAMAACRPTILNSDPLRQIGRARFTALRAVCRPPPGETLMIGSACSPRRHEKGGAALTLAGLRVIGTGFALPRVPTGGRRSLASAPSGLSASRGVTRGRALPANTASSVPGCEPVALAR